MNVDDIRLAYGKDHIFGMDELSLVEKVLLFFRRPRFFYEIESGEIQMVKFKVLFDRVYVLEVRRDLTKTHGVKSWTF